MQSELEYFILKVIDLVIDKPNLRITCDRTRNKYNNLFAIRGHWGKCESRVICWTDNCTLRDQINHYHETGKELQFMTAEMIKKQPLITHYFK